MNRYALVFLLVCFSFSVQAQFESSKKKVNFSAMPQKAAKTKAIVPEVTTSSPAIKFESKLFKNNDDKLLKGLPELPKVGEYSSPKTYELKNPSEIYTEKFNQKSSDGTIQEKFKSDTFLGEFRSNSKTIRIACRDHEYPDGDMVRILVNDKIMVNSILLEVEYKEIFLDLQPGFNKIEFLALNQGDSGPNTAQFVVFDDKGNLVTTNKWNLTTGVKAKIIVVKEEAEKK